VDACLVELDPALAETARAAAGEAGVRLEVRTGDAAATSTYADRLPVVVLLLVGVLGNVGDDDADRTVAAAASMVVPGGTVIWSRSNRFRSEPTHDYTDPAAWVRDRFEAHGFETREYLVPDVDAWRLGVSVLRRPSAAPLPETLFSFVR
jgi:hypothetical protein